MWYLLHGSSLHLGLSIQILWYGLIWFGFWGSLSLKWRAAFWVFFSSKQISSLSFFWLVQKKCQLLLFQPYPFRHSCLGFAWSSLELNQIDLLVHCHCSAKYENIWICKYEKYLNLPDSDYVWYTSFHSGLYVNSKNFWCSPWLCCCSHN